MQEVYRYARQATQSSEAREDAWLKLVYGPVDRLMGKIMAPLKTEIRKLSADPFDDELMEGFMAYLEQGRTWLGQAQDKFQSMANPVSTAGVAAHKSEIHIRIAFRSITIRIPSAAGTTPTTIF